MLTTFVEERPVKRLKGEIGAYDPSSATVRVRRLLIDVITRQVDPTPSLHRNVQTSSRNSPDQPRDALAQGADAVGLLPATTPGRTSRFFSIMKAFWYCYLSVSVYAALGRLRDCFAVVSGDSSNPTGHLESRQLYSLQRRFETQQVLETPQGVIAAEEDTITENVEIVTADRKSEEPEDQDDFFIFTQPEYERVASQRVAETPDVLQTPCRLDGEELERVRSANDLQIFQTRMSSKSYDDEPGSQRNQAEDAREEEPGDRLTPAVHSADRVQLSHGGPSFFPIFRSKKDCKIVYLIRHGESEFNAACSARGSAWEDPLLFDAKLTVRGRRQALELRKDVVKWDLPEDVLWITSPLSRAIETMLHVHPKIRPSDFSCDEDALDNVLVLPDVTEKLHTSGDIGRNPSDLLNDFPMLAKQLKGLSDAWWYSKDGRPNCPYEKLFQSHEPKDSISKRISKFRKWIIDRPEKAFVAVGHSMFWRDFATACHNGIKQDTMRNCEWRVIHV